MQTFTHTPHCGLYNYKLLDSHRNDYTVACHYLSYFSNSECSYADRAENSAVIPGTLCSTLLRAGSYRYRNSVAYSLLRYLYMALQSR